MAVYYMCLNINSQMDTNRWCNCLVTMVTQEVVGHNYMMCIVSGGNLAEERKFHCSLRGVCAKLHSFISRQSYVMVSSPERLRSNTYS